jgi:hypothetical protein
MLTETQVIGIYQSVEVPQYSEACTKYNNKNWKWENKDFPRIPSLIAFNDMVCEFNLLSKKMLTFNALSDPELEYLKTDLIHNILYDSDKIKNDIHSFNFADKDYDFVMVNQTLEHIYNPFKALANIHNHMCTGGYIYLNVPCVNIPHSMPNHFYTGFTATGLGALVTECGFKVLRLGQWGNMAYLTKLFIKGWTDFRENIWDNDKNCPIICWVLAKK